MDLGKLQPKALAAAMKGGTAGWGQVASSVEHVRYAQPVRPTSRRRCHCGCNQRATHMGMANGMALTRACELGIQRWIKTGHVRATKTPNVEVRGCATAETSNGELNDAKK